MTADAFAEGSRGGQNETRRGAAHASERARGTVNIYQPISALRREGKEEEVEEERRQKQRVDAPLIDLHKIAVSWLRLLSVASRTAKRTRQSGRTRTRRTKKWLGKRERERERRGRALRYESRYAV